MADNHKCPFSGHSNNTNLLIMLVLAGLLTNFLPNFEVAPIKAEAETMGEQKIPQSLGFKGGLSMVQDNSLVAMGGPSLPSREVVSKVSAILTAYSSTVWETDEDPFITASGKFVRDGVVANNSLPFGTKIKIPELYGEKVFIIEDRMGVPGKSNFDIWFPSYWEAKNFGKKYSYIEILRN